MFSKIHHILRCVAIIVATMALISCASGPYNIQLMPAPDVYDDGAINPFTDENPIKQIPYGGILYATNRKPDTEGDGYYENDRDTVLRLGVAQVQSGKINITWEEARKISLAKNRTDQYPLQVTGINELGILDHSFSIFTDPALKQQAHEPAKMFAYLVNKKLALSKRKDIYIYVHGYKVVFENPLLVGMELWHFLGYDGVALAFAWPSTPSRWAYFSDLETASLSAHYLRALLHYLASDTSAENIHIIGYSAGTRVVIETLHQLALERKNQDRATIQNLRIGQVILVGSDYDRFLFGAYLADGLLTVPKKLSVYLSGTDKALGLSRWLFARERLGQSFRDKDMPETTVNFLNSTEKLDAIDVTDAEQSDAGNGHAYFRQSPWASSDILSTLMYSLSPQERGLVREGNSPLWTFPPDYIAKLRRKLIEVNPDLAGALIEPAAE